ncbi:MAG: dihydrolipoamide acetyltransferase [Pseudomonadota bacterium]
MRHLMFRFALLSAALVWGGVLMAQAEGETTVEATPPAAGDPSSPAAAGTETAVDPAPAPAPAAGASDLKTADESYEVKIRDIEERVNELKEKIFQSKVRLLSLQEAVFTGVSSGARAVLTHRNEMGSTFRLTELHYFIDGAPLRQEVDATGETLSAKEEIQLFSGNIVPGNHQITVNLVYKGHGYGVFAYLDGYTFRIKSSYTFKAEEGKETEVKIVAFEKGGFTTELKDRPAVRYDIEVKKQQRRKQKAEGEQAAPSVP